MKLYSKKEILPIILILAFLAVGLYFLPQLPERVPTHWGIDGQADGWSSRNFAVWFFPALIAGMYLLLSFLPLLDPLKKNIEISANFYFVFKLVMVLFLGGLYTVTLYAGLGHPVNVQMFVLWGMAILFFFLGLMMPRIKKNYTVGIRLPWTLHSEEVWNKTHKFGGKLFIALAVLVAIVSFFPGGWAFGLMLGGILAMLAALMIYSYLAFRKIK